MVSHVRLIFDLWTSYILFQIFISIMEVGKYTFAPNEVFCQLVARLHKSNNGGCFHHFTTINCRSFGDSFVNKMAHEDFFLVVWQAIVITRPFLSIRHTVQCCQNLKLYFSLLFFQRFSDIFKKIRFSRYLQVWPFLLLLKLSKYVYSFFGR